MLGLNLHPIKCNVKEAVFYFICEHPDKYIAIYNNQNDVWVVDKLLVLE